MNTWNRPIFSATGYNSQQSRFDRMQMAELNHFQSLFKQLESFKATPNVFHSQPKTDEFVKYAMSLSSNN
jgi:hypothetical protein